MFKTIYIFTFISLIFIIGTDSKCSDYDQHEPCSCQKKTYQLNEGKECKINKVSPKSQEYVGFKYDIEGEVLCCKGLICCDYDVKVKLISQEQHQKQRSKKVEFINKKKEKKANKLIMKKERKQTLEEEFDGSPIGINTLLSKEGELIDDFLGLPYQLIESKCNMVLMACISQIDEDIGHCIMMKLELILTTYQNHIGLYYKYIMTTDESSLMIGYKYLSNHENKLQYLPSSGGNHILPFSLNYKIMAKHCYFSIDNDENAEMINFSNNFNLKFNKHIVKKKDKNRVKFIMNFLKVDFKAMIMIIKNPENMVAQNNDENYSQHNLETVKGEYKKVTKEMCANMIEFFEELNNHEFSSLISELIQNFIEILMNIK